MDEFWSAPVAIVAADHGMTVLPDCWMAKFIIVSLKENKYIDKSIIYFPGALSDCSVDGIDPGDRILQH